MTPADLAKIEADNEDSDKNDPEYIGVADTIRALVAEVRRLRRVDKPTIERIAFQLYLHDKGEKDWPSWSAIGFLSQAQYKAAVQCVLAARALHADVSDGPDKIPGLSLESINLFRSHHGSRYDRNPTCSDSELTGGYVPGSNQLPRCPRCTLLIALRDGELPASLSIETAFQGNGGD